MDSFCILVYLAHEKQVYIQFVYCIINEGTQQEGILMGIIVD